MVANWIAKATLPTIIIPLIILGFTGIILAITSMTLYGEVYSELE